MIHAVMFFALAQSPPLGQVPPKPEKKIGTLAKEAITRVVNTHAQDWSRCFELPWPSTEGAKTKIEWTVTESGTVKNAHAVTPDPKFEAFQRCLTDAISSWKFPKPSGGAVIVVFPFNP